MPQVVSKDRERILCAAIYYPNDDELIHGPYPFANGHIVCGHRHAQIIELYHKLTGVQQHRPEFQGFLTSGNGFVTRETAAKIAYEAGQISEKKHTLFSEDLY